MRTACSDGGVALTAVLGDAHHDDPAIVGGGIPFCESGGDQTLDGSGGARRIDAEPLCELLHRPVVASQQVEGVHLPRLERVIVTEQVVAQVVASTRRAAVSIQARPIRIACSTSIGFVKSMGSDVRTMGTRT